MYKPAAFYHARRHESHQRLLGPCQKVSETSLKKDLNRIGLEISNTLKCIGYCIHLMYWKYQIH